MLRVLNENEMEMVSGGHVPDDLSMEELLEHAGEHADQAGAAYDFRPPSGGGNSISLPIGPGTCWPASRIPSVCRGFESESDK